MTRWNLAAVEKAAPDAASLTAARRLAAPGPWSETGSTETLVWGKCQGSGKTPYQVSVDLSGPAYRCSCPSRKFPCKHALALLMLWVRGDGAVADAAEAPEATSSWAQGRATPSATKAEAAPVDPEARAKRLAARLELMDAGMADFELWLSDVVRAGTAAARRQPWSWWDQAAARLVDAQLGGVADRVRAMGSEVNRRDDWAEHLLTALGSWWSVAQAWRRWADLDERTRADLRTYVGWGQSAEDVRAGATVGDTWLVLGAHRSDDGRLQQQQRTWLHGERSGLSVQLLDFAAGSAPLPLAHLAGSVLEATLALYPGSGPRRALVVGDPEVRRDPVPLPAGVGLDAAYGALAGAWADNPWTVRVPVVLADAALRTGPDGTLVVDPDGACAPLLAETVPWSALAISGGAPTLLVGELESRGFRVLSVAVDDTLVAV